MLKHNDFFAPVQAELGSIGGRPAAVRVYHSYGNGKLLGTADTKAQADRIPGTKFVEAVVTNQDEINEWNRHEALVMSTINNRWLDALRSEFSHLTDNAFKELYSYAHYEVHSDGYDVIAEKMSDLDALFQKMSDPVKTLDTPSQNHL